MVLLTVADVVLRSFFATPIRGMLELVELGLACTIFLALPAVFLRGEHLVAKPPPMRHGGRCWNRRLPRRSSRPSLPN